MSHLIKLTTCNFLFLALFFIECASIAQEKPAAKGESLREPATVEAAAKVLDLRTFPRIEGAKPDSMSGLGLVMYEAPAPPKQAFEFQRKQLIQTGWKELPGAHVDEKNASAHFTKEGYTVDVSTSESHESPKKAGWSSITLVNHGNIDASKLPVPQGAKPFTGTITEGTYITEAKVPETAEACCKLLIDAGWEPYGKGSDDPNSPMLYFKRNAIRLTAWVSFAPALGNKTLVRYSTELLSADLPAPPDAPKPDYDDFQKTLRIEWPDGNAEPIMAFYQKRLAEQGWKTTTERPVVDDRSQTQFLVFRNPQKDMISLDLARFKKLLRVTVRHQTGAEVAAAEKQYHEEAAREREKLAKQSTKNTTSEPKTPNIPDLPGVPDVGKLLQGLSTGDEPTTKSTGAKKTAAPTGPAKVADIPFPKDAKVEYSKTTKMIKVSSPSDVRTLATFFTEGLAQQGWTTPSSTLASNTSAILTFTRGTAELTIFVRSKESGSEATVICKGLVWDDAPSTKQVTAPKKSS